MVTNPLALNEYPQQAGRRPPALIELAEAAMRQITAGPTTPASDAIGPLLGDLGRIMNADFVEMLEVSGPRECQPRAIRRARWAAGRGATGNFPGGWPADELVRQWVPALRKGGTIHGPVDAAGNPASDGLGASSAAVLPIQVAGQWWGVLVIHDPDPCRSWDPAEITGLRAMVAAIGALVQTGLAQDRLAEIRARYQTLVEQIPAILYIDLPQESRTAYVSPQIEPILGVTPGEWLSKADLWMEMLHPQDREWVLAQYREFVENGGPHLTEYRMVRPDGRIVWIRDRAQAVRDEQGHVVLEQGLMIDVTELKEAEATAQRQASLLERVDSVGRELTELVLQGGDPGQILRVLSGVVENPVLLEDAAHQLIDFAAHSCAVDDVLEAWDAHSRVGHPDNPNGVMIHDESTPRCAWIPLSIRGDLWGRLHVLEVDHPLDHAASFPLDRAAAAISLALLSQRDAAHLSDHARSTLISSIARGTVVATGEIFRRARSLGADLEGKTLAGLVLELRGTGGREPNPDLPEHDRQRVRMRVLDEMRLTLSEARCTCLSGLEGDRVLALLGLPAGRRPRDVLEQVATSACRRVEALGADMALVVGVSRPSVRPAFGRLLTEAMEAATFGLPGADRWRVHHFGELGVHRLLARLAEGPELSSFVESELSPLLDHDATAKVPLLPTLAAYLEHGGRKAAAARALHLERRTLYFRIDRIEKLLGRDLDDREIQLRCHLALRGLELLKRRAPSLTAPGDSRADHRSPRAAAHT